MTAEEATVQDVFPGNIQLIQTEENLIKHVKISVLPVPFLMKLVQHQGQPVNYVEWVHTMLKLEENPAQIVVHILTTMKPED